jgi:hypothetical protein
MNRRIFQRQPFNPLPFFAIGILVLQWKSICWLSLLVIIVNYYTSCKFSVLKFKNPSSRNFRFLTWSLLRAQWLEHCSRSAGLQVKLLLEDWHVFPKTWDIISLKHLANFMRKVWPWQF